MTANAWRINVVVSAPCKVDGNRSQNLPQGSSSWGPAALPQKSLMLVWRMTSCAPLTSLAWCSYITHKVCCEHLNNIRNGSTATIIHLMLE